jgi:hypothetical protein
MTYMADTLEQIAEQIMRDHGHCDLYACCGHCREHEAAILSALQSLARERDALRANEDAIRSAYGWKRDGRELPALVAELAASLSAQEFRGQEGE